VKTKGATSTVVSLAWTASTDNSGSVSYMLYRNGTLLGTSSGTTFQDGTTAAKGGVYSYQVVAVDPSKNVSAKSNAASVTR
jgi:chitodextrinase